MLTVLENKRWLPEVKAQLTEKGFVDKASALAEALIQQAQKWSGNATKAFDQVRQHPLLRSVVLTPYAKAPAAAVGAVRLALEPSALMHKKLRALDATGVKVASWPMLQYDMEPLLAQDAKLTMLPMLGVLALSLLIALKSLRDALIAIALLMLSLAWVLVLVLAQSKAGPHFLHILGLVLLMGAGLDYMLHMIFALRRVQGAVAPVMASTGMAVIFCALSTAIGFGSLLFASNHAMADLGLISAAGVLFVLCLALFLLPSMLRRKTS
jgi:predicted RND superfamily exporter protein